MSGADEIEEISDFESSVEVESDVAAGVGRLGGGGRASDGDSSQEDARPDALRQPGMTGRGGRAAAPLASAPAAPKPAASSTAAKLSMGEGGDLNKASDPPCPLALARP